MKYAHTRDGKVCEIIPEFDPVFPSIPISQRYSTEFLQNLLEVADDTDVQPNMLYNPDTGEFIWPEPEPAPEPSPVDATPPEPTAEERNRADIDYLALMMGVDLL